MFTGIVEETGKITGISKQNSNTIINVSCSFIDELKINQSVCHNGICLSVFEIKDRYYQVCAVKETMKKSNLDYLEIGSLINLERCMKVGDRFDGHFVQGHVDCTLDCVRVEDLNGSWKFSFKFDKAHQKYLIPQGSISINGVSLTISKINTEKNYFNVDIIPYTFNNTNLKNIEKNSTVNIEFDILAKQIANLNHFKS